MPPHTTVPQAFPYRGSKTRLTAFLSGHVPTGTKTLLSLFAGSGVFEYNYAHDHPDARVICYEIDRRIVNFHARLSDDAAQLYGAIVALNESLSQMSKDKFTSLNKSLGCTTLEDAAAFYVVAVNSFGGKLGSYGHKRSFAVPKYMLTTRIPGNMRVVHGDAFEAIRTAGDYGEGTFVYMDPPYHMNNGHYNSVRNNKFDHGALARAVSALPRSVRWALSYNDVPEVRDLYGVEGKTENEHYFRPACKHILNNANSNANEILITGTAVGTHPFGCDRASQPRYCANTVRRIESPYTHRS